MKRFFEVALYSKNVPAPERWFRVVGGLGLMVAAVALSSNPAVIVLAVFSGVFVAATGFYGFCPACYFAGRKLLS